MHNCAIKKWCYENTFSISVLLRIKFIWTFFYIFHIQFYFNVINIMYIYFKVSQNLKDSWIISLRANIRSPLRDVGKGWFNIHETNWEVYQISKLKKFMESVKFIMQVQKLFVFFVTYIMERYHKYNFKVWIW